MDEGARMAEEGGLCALVVPCFNEAARFRAEAFARFLKLEVPVHLFLVNDGSTDGTLGLLEAFRDQHPFQVSVIDQQPNVGKGEAVRRAMRSAVLERRYRFVGFWDADLATPLDQVPRFIETLRERPQVAMVFGARVRLLGRSVMRNPLRHYLGRGFATAVSTMLRLPVYDTQCGAKLFRVSPQLEQILAEPFTSRWIFDVEMIARYMVLPGVGRAGAEQTIYELPLDAWHDIAGSKLSAMDFLKAVGELVVIRRKYFG